VLDQPSLDLAFLGFGSEGEKVKVARVFDKLLCQVGLRRRQRCGKVCDGFLSALVETTFDLMDENVAAPAAGDGLPDVPFSFGGAPRVREDADIVPLRNLCNNLLHKWLVRIGLGQGTHILEVAWGQASHFRKCVA